MTGFPKKVKPGLELGDAGAEVGEMLEFEALPSCAESYLCGRVAIHLHFLGCRIGSVEAEIGDLCALVYLPVVAVQERLHREGAVVVGRKNSADKGGLTNVRESQGHMYNTVLVSVPEPMKASQPVIARSIDSLVRLELAEECLCRLADEAKEREALKVLAGVADGECDIPRALRARLLRILDACELPSDVIEGGAKIVDKLPDPNSHLGIGFLDGG